MCSVSVLCSGSAEILNTQHRSIFLEAFGSRNIRLACIPGVTLEIAFPFPFVFTLPFSSTSRPYEQQEKPT